MNNDIETFWWFVFKYLLDKNTIFTMQLNITVKARKNVQG